MQKHTSHICSTFQLYTQKISSDIYFVKIDNTIIFAKKILSVRMRVLPPIILLVIFLVTGNAFFLNTQLQFVTVYQTSVLMPVRFGQLSSSVSSSSGVTVGTQATAAYCLSFCLYIQVGKFVHVRRGTLSLRHVIFQVIVACL